MFIHPAQRYTHYAEVEAVAPNQTLHQLKDTTDAPRVMYDPSTAAWLPHLTPKSAFMRSAAPVHHHVEKAVWPAVLGSTVLGGAAGGLGACAVLLASHPIVLGVLGVGLTAGAAAYLSHAHPQAAGAFKEGVDCAAQGTGRLVMDHAQAVGKLMLNNAQTTGKVILENASKLVRRAVDGAKHYGMPTCFTSAMPQEGWTSMKNFFVNLGGRSWI